MGEIAPTVVPVISWRLRRKLPRSSRWGSALERGVLPAGCADCDAVAAGMAGSGPAMTRVGPTASVKDNRCTTPNQLEF